MSTFEHYKQVIPADYYECVLEHHVTGAPDVTICTFGVYMGGASMNDAILDDIADVWSTKVLPACHPTVVFYRITASDAGGVVSERFPGTNGADTNDPAPVSTAIIIAKRTGTSGRRYRGRMYVPAVNDTLVDIGGNLDPTVAAAYQAEIDDVLPDLAAKPQAIQMVLLHSKGWDGAVEPADPGNAPAPTVVTSLVVQPRIGTQRRRIR